MTDAVVRRPRRPAGPSHVLVTKANGSTSSKLPAVQSRSTSPTPVTAPPPRRDLVRDSYSSTAFADVLDRSMHETGARFGGALSMPAL